MDFKLTLVKLKVRFDRGLYWINYLRDFLIVAMALKLFDVPLIYLIPLGVFGFILVSALGYFDYKHGIWLTEAEYVTREVNPYFKKLENNIAKARE